VARKGSNPNPPTRGAEQPQGGGTFENVVLCHVGLIYQLAVRLCGNRHGAEDLVQETFLKAHRAFERFELREYGAKPWLIKILNHAFFTHRSQSGRHPSSLPEADLPDDAAAVEAPQSLPDMVAGRLNWESYDDELKTAVNDLPIEYRSVILLWAVGELGYREIADCLNCPIGTVMSRLHRGRRMLTELLAEYAERRGITPMPPAKSHKD